MSGHIRGTASRLGRLVPAAVLARLRPIYWRVAGITPAAIGFDALPDRVFLHERLLPALAEAGARRVLFVGTRHYTEAVPRIAEKHGIELWTSDIDPEAARFGAPGRHFTADIREMAPIDGGTLDAVLLNGVFGFGVDLPEDCRRSLARIGAMLPAGGLLVVGWNIGGIEDPAPLVLDAGFARASLSDTPSRITFEGSSHVYDVFRRLP